MKSSTLLAVVALDCLTATKAEKVPFQTFPPLKNEVVCFSKSLTITYLDGFTHTTYATPIIPTRTKFHPNPGETRAQRARAEAFARALSAAAVAEAISEAHNDDDDDNNNNNNNNNNNTAGDPDVSIQKDRKKPMICTYWPMDWTWKSKIMLPRWLPTSTLITATLNSYVTVTELTAISTDYWIHDTRLVPGDRPHVTVKRREGGLDGQDEDDSVSLPPITILPTGSAAGYNHTAVVYVTVTETITEASCT
ncbi:hypothetical protein GGS24DRAFT_515990 [Hypoxylon argillaceum]|nr:hypothetical protein GGS24DRAFT_515990 [Hypoxylon argillaceum]